MTHHQSARRSDAPPKQRPINAAKRKAPLPPRARWPRAMQPQSARRPCAHCGRLDRAVSSRQQITYYGPTRCACGKCRSLRKVERPIDWQALRRVYQIPRELRDDDRLAIGD